jgi:signal transduction histidine kinase
MPIRLRITFLFTLAVFLILGIVCLAIYYFSENSRLNTIRKRLSNRALTMERLITQDEIFNRELLRRIDSSTALSLTNKSVQVFNAGNRRIYNYRENTEDSILVTTQLLDDIRNAGILYFAEGNKEVVGYHDREQQDGLVVISAAEDEDGLATLEQLKLILTVSFLGGTLIAFAVGWLFSQRVLSPIRKITNEVTDISGYNLDRRIQTGKSKDEWYELSMTLNALLDRLKESFELQRRFISNASHELSTPLTLISSQLEVSLQRHRSDEEYRRVMESVLQDVHHMNRLVQTLLKFATASGNAGGLNIDLVRVDEILMRLPAEMQKLDKSYSVSLSFDDLPEEEEKLLVFGNEELLFSAIKNIVSNGCKYSTDHHTSVSLAIKPRHLIVKVEDKGIGMEEKELENIFQPFYRIPDTSNIKGFGLGLSLANRIIKLHKGSIDVQSQPNKGTLFTISLPVARPG